MLTKAFTHQGAIKSLNGACEPGKRQNKFCAPGYDGDEESTSRRLAVIRRLYRKPRPLLDRPIYRSVGPLPKFRVTRIVVEDERPTFGYAQSPPATVAVEALAPLPPRSMPEVEAVSFLPGAWPPTNMPKVEAASFLSSGPQRSMDRSPRNRRDKHRSQKYKSQPQIQEKPSLFNSSKRSWYGLLNGDQLLGALVRLSRRDLCARKIKAADRTRFLDELRQISFSPQQAPQPHQAPQVQRQELTKDERSGDVEEEEAMNNTVRPARPVDVNALQTQAEAARLEALALMARAGDQGYRRDFDAGLPLLHDGTEQEGNPMPIAATDDRRQLPPGYLALTTQPLAPPPPIHTFSLPCEAESPPLSPTEPFTGIERPLTPLETYMGPTVMGNDAEAARLEAARMIAELIPALEADQRWEIEQRASIVAKIESAIASSASRRRE